ncbi:auxin-induced protein 6B-like [Miscanthus floridulus]|uniref:auxin-induced protein 6B-like n=1 Tax=Miscanthus floridulus TaxID=154761 RepID=UPI00345A5857
MMVMGYFRSSTKSTTSSSAAGGKNKKKAKNSCAPAREEAAGLREALLDQPAAAAAAEGGVPKGYFAVYAGEESRRFVVPTGYLQEPAFRDLMERAADEFGFAQAGGLRVPCAEEDFEDLLRRLQRKNGGTAAGKGKKAVVGR